MIEQELTRPPLMHGRHPHPEALAAAAYFEQRRAGWRGALASFVVTGSMAGVALLVTTALGLYPWVLF